MLGESVSPQEHAAGTSRPLVAASRTETLPDRPSPAAESADGDAMSADHYRDLFATASAGFWRFELDPPLPLTLDEEMLAAAILDHARLAECNPAYARRHGSGRARELQGRPIAELLPGTCEEQLWALRQFVRSGFRLEGFEPAARNGDRRTRTTRLDLVGRIDDGTLGGGWGTEHAPAEGAPAEETEGTNEDRLRFVLDNVQDIVTLVDPDGTIRFETPSVERALGYRPEEMIGRNAFELLHPDDLPRIGEAFRRLIENRDVPGPMIQLRARHKDGSWRRFEAIGKCPSGPELDHGVLIDFRDITDRTRAEDARRAAEERYRLVVENVGEAIAVIQDGRLQLGNPAAHRLVGRTPQEWPTGRVLELVHPGDRARVVRDMERVLAGEPGAPDLTCRIVWPDGTVRWVEVNAVRVDWELRPALLCFLGDVTERRQIETALRASERRYRLLFDGMLEGCAYCQMHFDAEGRAVDWTYLAVNPAFSRLTGLEDVVGRRVLEVLPGIARENPELFETYGRVARTGRPEEFDVDFHPLGLRLHISAFGPEPDHFVAVFEDVTDARVAADALRESEARLRQVTETGGEWVWEVDAEGLYRYCSPVVERILGYTPEELVGRKHFYDLFAPEVREELTRAAMAAFERREPVRGFLSPNLHRDGSTVVLETSGLPVLDAAGNLLGYRGTDTDVTERNRAQEALRESGETLRVFINAIPEPAILLDLDGTTLAVNQAMAAALGTTPEGMVGRDAFAQVSRPIAGERKARILEALRTSAPVQWEDERDGRTFLNHACPALDGAGRARCVAVFAFDITARKCAEDRLTTLVAAVEQAADDILLTDVDGIITYVNSAFERTTGYPRSEAVGRSPRFLDSGEHDEAFYQAIWETIRTGRTWQGRFRNRTRDGRIILQDASLSPIREAGGRIVGYVSARRDVTKQIELEEHAAQADKLEAIGTLAGGIAHDFNNILTAIGGYTQMALRKCPEDAAVRRDLQAVLQGSARAADLVKQILAFSRAEKLEEQPVQVGLVLKEALKLLRATIPTTIEIRADVRSDSVVLADPTEIHRMVVNLCTNAALAMHDHGGLLEVSLGDVERDGAFAARHPGVAPGRFLWLRVRDTGCGMSKAVLSRVFEPFFTTRERGKGTGMGLAVVHGITTRCRGAIEVESEPGRGTSFDVFLPVVEQEPASGNDEPDELPGGTESVLVVDDEPMVADLVADLLDGLGYRVRIARDGREALEAFEADPAAVDLVVTDMTMPGLTGDALARRVKELRPGLPVILCSGYSDRISADGARQQGIEAFVAKPASPAELARLVREVLDRN